MSHYDFARIEALARVRLEGDATKDSDIARLLGVDRTNFGRWRRTGLTAQMAERCAHALGLLDYEVWPELLDQAIKDFTVKCEAPDCSETFVSPALRWGQKRRRFCCATCQKRTNHRRRYQTNAETRERRKAEARRYKAEVREAQRRRAERRAAA